MKTKSKSKETDKRKQTKADVKQSVFKKSLEAKSFRSYAIIFPLLFIIAAFAVMLIYESEYLFRIQELNLFLFTSLFFKQCMVVAGGMLSYLGCFFTQFFYHQWLGALMLSLWFALLMWLIKRAFRISDKSVALLFYPVALLLLTDFFLGYWIFYLKMCGHFFASTIGFTSTVALIWAFRSLPSRNYLRSIFIVISTALLYPLIGFYSLLATLCMGVIDWKLADEKRNTRLINSVIVLVSVIAIPLIYYRTIYYQTNILNIYRVGLPLFRMDDNYPAYYIPYIFISAYLAIASITYKERRNGDVKHFGKWTLCQAVQLILIVFLTYHFWFKDTNFRTELKMNRCIENLDWEGVLSLARDETDTPTRLMVMNKNLALFRLGRSGDEMFHYLDGGKAPCCPFEMRMMQVGGKMLYLHYGKLNFCYRWCLEDGVEFGWRLDYYRYLIKCSLINGDYRVARKYIEILKHTLYYKDWAEKYEPYLRHPSLAKSDKEFAPIFHMLNYNDQLDGDNALVEMYLLNCFAREDSNDPLFQEQTLISSLQMKDIQMFWPKFMKYAYLHKGKHMPIHYQEAAILYGNLEHKVDISHMPFDNEVKQSFQGFMDLAKQCQGMTEEQMQPIFFPRYGNTFYYFYFLIRNVKSY